MDDARDPRTVTDAHDITELGDLFRLFVSKPGPREMAMFAAGAWTMRALHGLPRPSDFVAAALTAGAWPFQEWLAHKYLLHLEPTTLFGRPFDPYFAQRHRAHHQAPRDVDGTLLPIEVIRAAMPASFVAAHAIAPNRRLGWTILATYSTMAVIYEWNHLIVHTGYTPKSDWYRRLRRNHRLHHYRNENYWFGFTAPDVDRLLGTEPDEKSVPISKTAMDLHGLARKAANANAETTTQAS